MDEQILRRLCLEIMTKKYKEGLIQEAEFRYAEERIKTYFVGDTREENQAQPQAQTQQQQQVQNQHGAPGNDMFIAIDMTTSCVWYFVTGDVGLAGVCFDFEAKHTGGTSNMEKQV